MKITTDSDEHSFKLRGSPEEQKVIAAIERVSARQDAAGAKYSFSEIEIPQLKGVNSTDETIRQTLLIKYRIEISDSKLLEFSNYLVKLDPAYPLWSKQIYIRDYSRIDSAGFPRQTFIMTNPNRFHQTYLAFKKQTNPPPKP